MNTIKWLWRRYKLIKFCDYIRHERDYIRALFWDECPTPIQEEMGAWEYLYSQKP